VNSCTRTRSAVATVDFPLTTLLRLSFIDVTEIPEHLLKRSKAAKAKSEGAELPADAPAAPSSVPATTAAAAPAVAAKKDAAPVAPVAKPDTPVVAAYKARKKIPVWAMVTLSILPVWAFMYVLAMKPVTAVATGPLGDGAAVYANCASCHGAGGEGVAGGAYTFLNGSVTKTFPHIEDQLRWVKLGGTEYVNAGITIAGDPNREGGPHIVGSNGVMPGWKANLTDAEILAAVCEERYGLGGADQASAEFLLWCATDSAIYAALKDGSATFDNVHEKFADKGVLEIGSVPKAGTTAG
jgi:mono/diheme cytochrome c family protein